MFEYDSLRAKMVSQSLENVILAAIPLVPTACIIVYAIGSYPRLWVALGVLFIVSVMAFLVSFMSEGCGTDGVVRGCRTRFEQGWSGGLQIGRYGLMRRVGGLPAARPSAR